MPHLSPMHPARLAEQVLLDCRILRPPVCEEEILSYFRIDISRVPFECVPGCEHLANLEHRPSGMIIGGSNEPPLIWVEPGMSSGRTRWTIFHEVGHYNIPSHFEEGGIFIDDERALRPAEGRPSALPAEKREVGYQGILNVSSNPIATDLVPVTVETQDSIRRKKQEREANEYAAELILPMHMFSPEARDMDIGISTIQELARRYKASFEATAIRYAQACPERCIVFAAEPVLDLENGLIDGFKVNYCKRRGCFLSELRRGVLLPFAGIMREAWDAQKPIRGLFTSDLLGGGHRLSVAADAMRLGQYDRVVAVLWLESGQLIMIDERRAA